MGQGNNLNCGLLPESNTLPSKVNIFLKLLNI